MAATDWKGVERHLPAALARKKRVFAELKNRKKVTGSRKREDPVVFPDTGYDLSAPDARFMRVVHELYGPGIAYATLTRYRAARQAPTYSRDAEVRVLFQDAETDRRGQPIQVFVPAHELRRVPTCESGRTTKHSVKRRGR